MSGEGTYWKIEGDEALLECGNLRGRILLSQLSRGLCEVTWPRKRKRRSTSLATLMLYCGDKHPGCRRIETYIRGNDLVSNYDSDSPWGTPQVYWRVREHAAHSAVGIELILSKSTPLLDTDPGSMVDCAGFTLWHAAALDTQAFAPVRSTKAPIDIDGASSRTHLFLLRDEYLQLSYLQFVHPTDFVSALLIDQMAQFRDKYDTESWYVRSRLFPESLEKGVIRRARIGGWFLPTENDLAVAVELARQFIDEPLPLTT